MAMHTLNSELNSLELSCFSILKSLDIEQPRK